MHASAACLTPSSFWKLPGEKVCNCLPSRGSSSSSVKHSHTQILELSRRFSQVFLPFFCSIPVVTAGLGVQDCASEWEWEEIFRMGCEVITAPPQNEGKQSLSSYSDTVFCYLPVFYKAIFSFMSGSYLEMECHQEGLSPVEVRAWAFSDIFFQLMKALILPFEDQPPEELLVFLIYFFLRRLILAKFCKESYLLRLWVQMEIIRI